MKNQKGFSLIELLIVVVIIGIIAAIAIPNLLAARRSANEGSAISSLRTIHGAQMTYASTHGQGQYGSMANLSAANVGLIDSVLASATGKSGYLFTNTPVASTPTTPAVFTVTAAPQTATGVTATGTRYFGIATEGVVHSGTAAITGAAGVLTGGTPMNN